MRFSRVKITVAEAASAIRAIIEGGDRFKYEAQFVILMEVYVSIL